VATAIESDEPAAGSITCERGGQMAPCRIDNAALNMKGFGKRRVHQNDSSWAHAGIPIVIDVSA